MRRETDKDGVAKKLPIGKITAMIGAVAGVISIIAFSGNVVDAVDDYVVFEADLKAAKEEVIEHIHKEAVITRDVIVGEILIRKNKLNDDLEDAETEGEIARILQHIKELNAQLDKIKGIDK